MEPIKRIENDDGAACAPVPPMGRAPAAFAPPPLVVPLLARERLLDRMHDARAQRVTLVRAPGGFGKTVLLSQWWDRLEKENVARIWLRLGERHSQCDRFLADLVAAASCAGFDTASADEESPPNDDSTTEVAGKFADMLARYDGEIVIFLDDYHLSRSKRVDTMLDQLLRDAGPHMHFVIATRRSPGIAVQTLRIEGQLSEIGVQDLRFTAEDTMRLFDQKLEKEALAALLSKTEGWPGALQMAKLGLARGRTIDVVVQELSGRNHEVAAYLSEKILKGLPEEIVDLLIRTSMLSLVNGDIADFMCERTDGWAVLNGLDETGTFLIPITAERRWYRYHHLLSEFLQYRLQQTGRAEVRLLHERASQWYEDQGRVIDAACHALRAGDLDRVEALIENAEPGSFWLMDRFSNYVELIDSLPGEVATRLPRLWGVRAIQLIKTGNEDEARVVLQTMRDDLKLGGKTDTDRQRSALDLLLIDAILQFYLSGPVDTELVADLEKAIDDYSADTRISGALRSALAPFYHRLGENEKAVGAVNSALGLYLDADTYHGAIFLHLLRGMFALAAGQLENALKDYRRADDLFYRYNGDPDLKTLVTLCKGEALYERGDFADAHVGLRDALEHASLNDGSPEMLIGGYRTASALAFSEDGYAGAMAVLDRAETVAGDRNLSMLANWTLTRRIYLAAIAGKTDEANDLCARQGVDPQSGGGAGEGSWHEVFERRLALARLAFAEKRYPEALREFDALARGAHARGFGWLELKATLLKAAALIKLDRTAEAMPLMARLLEQTRAETMPSLILEEGELPLDPIERFVREIGISELAAEEFDWIIELLARASDFRSGRSLNSDSLTQREREVIEALRESLPTKRIADKLAISDSAAAFHLKNIFKKVGVRNRHLVIPVAEKRRLLNVVDVPHKG